jgi:hypothetical protein
VPSVKQFRDAVGLEIPSPLLQGFAMGPFSAEFHRLPNIRILTLSPAMMSSPLPVNGSATQMY